MLVLTRQEGDVVHIGNDISVVVVRIKGQGGVRLGFVAPSNVPIVRGELTTEGHADGDNGG